MQPKVGGVWDQGGATNISMISFACMAIDAGQCEVAIVCLADDPKTGTRQAYEKAWGDDAAYGWFCDRGRLRHDRCSATWPNTAPRPEQFGEIAVAVRNHGANNPHAALRVPLTLDKYMESPFIIEPLRRDDICLVSDGAAAVVVMSEQRARELGVKAPVKILGFGQGQTSYDVPLRPVLTETMAKASAQTAFRMAGLAPKDIDVAQIYDCYTIAVMMTLEDYGFCKQGRRRQVGRGRARRGRRRTADQHLRRTALGDRHAGPAARDGGRAPDARHIGQSGEGCRDLRRVEPGRHHDHALDLDFGALNETFRCPNRRRCRSPIGMRCEQGRLTFQRCRHCANAGCRRAANVPKCLAAEWDWTDASGKGRVISWVTYHHAYHEAFRDRLPYNVALVELDEGPRLITNIVNADAGLKAERPVKLKIEDEHGVALARFALT